MSSWWFSGDGVGYVRECRLSVKLSSGLRGC
jgi:hypothetical protein